MRDTWRETGTYYTIRPDCMSALLGLLMMLGALLEQQQQIVYVAEAKEVEVLIEIETEEMKIERLVREEFTDAPIMVEVARCESEFKNVPGRTSDDFGPLQINYIHLPELGRLGLDRTKVEDNIKFARILYNEQGLKPWKNSQGCWGKYAT